MVRVHFTVEVDEMDKNLTSKSLKQIVDLWTASVQQRYEKALARYNDYYRG